MSEITHDPDQESGGVPSEDDEDRHIPSTEQDVASGQPYDPRKDPGRDPGSEDESATDG